MYLINHTIIARLWYNLPICAEFARGKRMCKAFRFIINALRLLYHISEALWYNRPIRTEQIFDLRMCEDF